MIPKIMLIGLGDLGSVTLELLARRPNVGRIVVGSRSVARTEARCNLARLGAMAQGRTPDIRFVPLDLTDRQATAETIAREQPDLIYSTATLQTWWLPGKLPPPQARRIHAAGFGVWLPVNLALTLKLMQAVRLANFTGPVLTAPFPDVVNPILDKLGLAPTCGVGNVDELVPKVRWLAARALAATPDDLQVWLVAHHAFQPFAFGQKQGDPPPHFLRVEWRGRDVTPELDAQDVLFAPYPLTGGPASHFLTAGSTVRLILALLADADTFLHAPAPNGLPGGYPVLAGRGVVRLADIPGLSAAQAVDINRQSHRFDGIERIEPDGTAVFTPHAAQILRDELGYDCRRLPPAEAGERAVELMARFREYARRHGVDLG